MPIFLVETRKASDGIIAAKWSNRYFVDVNDENEAYGQGLGIWDTAEKLVHDERVFCYEIYVNQQGDAPFTPGLNGAVPAGIQRGSRSALSRGEEMPLFNVVRCDFPVVNSRPSRKFYRPLLRTGDIDDGNINTATQTLYGQLVLALAQVTTLVDVDGEDWFGTGIVRGVTSRRLGRDSGLNVPVGPPLG